jgi:hypothetical protein
MNERRTDDSPGKNGATEEGEGNVEADKHTGANESRSPLKVPAPVLDSESQVAVLPPDEEPCIC